MMTDPDPSDERAEDLPLTTAADVESAGRSCLVIIVLAAVIVLMVLLWVALTALGFIQ